MRKFLFVLKFSVVFLTFFLSFKKDAQAAAWCDFTPAGNKVIVVVNNAPATTINYEITNPYGQTACSRNVGSSFSVGPFGEDGGYTIKVGEAASSLFNWCFKRQFLILGPQRPWCIQDILVEEDGNKISLVGFYDVCQKVPECENCLLSGGSWTALGCLPTGDPRKFLAWILSKAVGVAGGIALLLIIWGGFQVILSSGDPQKLQTGKEILTSAIVGLLFIIFSIFLLRFVGVQILKIPGLE